MSRSVLLSFLALSLFLVALPAALFKPGLPATLRGDEGTYLGLAGSLLEDHDVELTARDAERVVGQFPFAPTIELRLRSAKKGAGQNFDAPLLYPLLAVPALALLGSNGLMVLNLALILTATWLAALFLARRNLGRSALFFAVPFVLLSPAFLYAFWLRPSALLFFLGTVAFTEGWAEDQGQAQPQPAWRRALAGAALGLAAAHLPYLLILSLPLLARLWRRERQRCVLFAAALLAGFLLVISVQLAVLGTAFPGRDHEGEAYTFEKATDQPWREAGSAIEEPKTRPLTAKRLLFSLVERRRGFLPYFPLAILALVLWRSPRRDEALLLATLTASIVVQPWVGELDPGLPMNPALIPLYPAFLLFVRVIPQLGVVAASALATFLLGLQWVGVLGSPIPDAGVHGHVRAFPFPYLPLDIEEVQMGSGLLRLEVSGDEPAPLLWAAADQAMSGGRELWTYGGEKVELFLESRRPLEEIVLQVRSVGSPNRIELLHSGGRELYEFSSLPATSQRKIHLGPGETTTRGSTIYRFEIRSERGYKPYWTGESEGGDYIGAAVAYIGTPEVMARDLYAIEWQACGFAQQFPAGLDSVALVEARNASTYTWPSSGASRVRFASRWLDPKGKVLSESPSRSALLNPVHPGETVKTFLLVHTPENPGQYQLEFDAVYENVAWFSDRNDRHTCRQNVEILLQVP